MGFERKRRVLLPADITLKAESTTVNVGADYVLIYDAATGNLKKATISRMKDCNVRAVTANVTPTIYDDIILCSGANITVNVALVAAQLGKKLKIKKTDGTGANLVTVSGATIDGASSFMINTQYEAAVIVGNGSATAFRF